MEYEFTTGRWAKGRLWSFCTTSAVAARLGHRTWSDSLDTKDSYDDMNFTEPYLSTITARTLVFYGDRDELFPVDIAVGTYRAIPRAALWIIPNGGHIPIFGAMASAFQDQALAFLGSDAVGRAASRE
jgi:pimeloyl-ACP methyl ester carboxylesterase